MKKALAIGLAAAMAVTMTAPVYASDDSESGKGIAKEDLKIGAIYIGDENEGYTAAHMAGIDEMQKDATMQQQTLQIRDVRSSLQTASDMRLISLKPQENIRTYSSVMQPELRQHQADFPICTTTSQTFMKLVMCPV